MHAGDFMVENLKIKDFAKNYDCEKMLIGAGAFGHVYKAKHRDTGIMRAVKMIDKLRLNAEEIVLLQNEVNSLKNLTHPNIVKIYEIYENKNKFYLVTELAEGCELFEEISTNHSFNEAQAAVIMKQFLEAIAYCHSQNIVHRDLKPENVLVDINNQGNIKLIDFGASQHYDKEKAKLTGAHGTPYYIAPEVLVNSQ